MTHLLKGACTMGACTLVLGMAFAQGCAASHGPEPDEPCRMDADCGEGLVCVAGGECAAACDADRDCPAGASCVAGRCATCTCAADADCDFGLRCHDCTCSIDEPLCFDDDGDGFYAGPDCDGGAEIDCDDADPTAYPGAPEICGDGIDQNCVDGPDDCCGCECSASPRDCGLGICAGVQTCTPHGWSECIPLGAPGPEECGPDGRGNGLDEDCNGAIDDGCLAP